MIHILIKGTVAAILTIALLYVTTANAQTQSNTTAKVNMTASKTPGNATAKVNATVLKVLANTTAKLNMTASKVPGSTTANVNQTASESGKHNTTANILNKTEELGKKIAGGLGSLLGNASEKLKQGSK
jgi:hypothetical protein